MEDWGNNFFSFHESIFLQCEVQLAEFPSRFGSFQNLPRKALENQIWTQCWSCLEEEVELGDLIRSFPQWFCDSALQQLNTFSGCAIRDHWSFFQISVSPIYTILPLCAFKSNTSVQNTILLKNKSWSKCAFIATTHKKQKTAPLGNSSKMLTHKHFPRTTASFFFLKKIFFQGKCLFQRRAQLKKHNSLW